MEILSNLNTPSALFALLLALGVVFVNGFTDAPNAISTVVATGTLSMTGACILCAVCNLSGLLFASKINMSVASNLLKLASIEGHSQGALTSVFLSVIAFSLCAWLFSMPSSESHAIISALIGASLAINSKAKITPIFGIIFYMLLSCALAMLGSVLISRLLGKIRLPYGKLQILSCALTSVMHGAQDGQKLVAILLLLVPASVPHGTDFCVLSVCVALFFGTLLGGARIVKSMGSDICALNSKSAFVSDISATLCLILCSFYGFSVSTSNIKACSIAGAGLESKTKINLKTLLKIALTALVTFPVCIALGYAIARALI